MKTRWTRTKNKTETETFSFPERKNPFFSSLWLAAACFVYSANYSFLLTSYTFHHHPYTWFLSGRKTACFIIPKLYTVHKLCPFFQEKQKGKKFHGKLSRDFLNSHGLLAFLAHTATLVIIRKPDKTICLCTFLLSSLHSTVNAFMCVYFS